MCLNFNNTVPGYSQMSSCEQMKISFSGSFNEGILRMYEGSKNSHVFIQALSEVGINCLHALNTPIAIIETIFRTAVALVVALVRMCATIPSSHLIDDGWKVSFSVMASNIGRTSVIGVVAGYAAMTFFVIIAERIL